MDTVSGRERSSTVQSAGYSMLNAPEGSLYSAYSKSGPPSSGAGVGGIGVVVGGTGTGVSAEGAGVGSTPPQPTAMMVSMTASRVDRISSVVDLFNLVKLLSSFSSFGPRCETVLLFDDNASNLEQLTINILRRKIK